MTELNFYRNKNNFFREMLHELDINENLRSIHKIKDYHELYLKETDNNILAQIFVCAYLKFTTKIYDTDYEILLASFLKKIITTPKLRDGLVKKISCGPFYQWYISLVELSTTIDDILVTSHLTSLLNNLSIDNNFDAMFAKFNIE